MTDSPNVELARSIYAGTSRGELRLSEWAHPDVQWVVLDGPEPGRRVGVADVERRWRRFREAWEDFRVEAEEYRVLGDQRVLVLNRRTGRGKGSGLELDATGADLIHVRDGKVTKFVVYFDRDRALADLGLASD